MGRSTAAARTARVANTRHDYLAEHLEARVLLAAVSWDGGGDGSTWTDPLNWSTNALPGPADDVTISVAGTPTITVNSGSQSVRQLVSDESLAVFNATLAVGTAALNADVTVGTSSALRVSTSLSLAGTATMAGRNAILVLEANQTFDSGTFVLLDEGRIIGFQSLTLGPAVTVRGGRSGGVFGTFGVALNIVNRGTIAGDTPGGDLRIEPARLENRGTLRATGGGGLSVTGLTGDLGAVDLSGDRSHVSLASAAGANFVNNAGLTVPPGTTLELSGRWRSAAPLSVQGGTLNFSGSFTTADLNLAQFSRSGGAVRLHGATLDNSSATLALNAATGPWELDSSTVVGGTLEFSGGASLVPVTTNNRFVGVRVRGDFRIGSVASIQVAAPFSLDGTVTIAGPFAFLMVEGSQTFDSGTFVLQGTDPQRIMSAGPPATLTLGPGVTVRGRGELGGGNGFGPLTLINHGTIEADDPTGALAVVAPSFTNAGTARAVGGGSLDVHAPLTVTGSGVLASDAKSKVSVYDSLGGPTTNADRYAPAGSLLAIPGATPLPLEVMGRDLGATPAGFGQNFGYGTLDVVSNTVRLVDQSDNAPGVGPEALYVGQLIVRAGTTLDLNGLRLYARAPQIAGTIVGGAVTVVPDGGPLTLGLATPGRIGLPGEVDEWTFFGRLGNSLTVQVNPWTGAPAPPLVWADVQLLDVDGNVLASDANAAFGGVIRLGNVQLPANGTYRVRVRASAVSPAATGGYMLTAWDVTPDVAALTLNQPAVGVIETPFGVDRWTFSANAGQQVQFDLTNAAATGVVFTLAGPGGFTAFSNLAGDSGLINLPVSGRFTLTVAGTGGQPGGYAFRLAETSLTDLPVNSTANGRLAGEGSAQLFRVSLAAASPLFVTLDDATDGDRTELYLRLGSPPTRGDYDYRAADGAAADQAVLVPSAVPGTWYALVYGDRVPAASDFSIRADTTSVRVTGMTPDQYGAGGTVTATLTGAGFGPGVQAALVSAGGTTYPAATSAADSFTQLTATFNLTGVPTGRYAVRVTKPDGDASTLSDAFTVKSAGSARFEARVIVPEQLGRHALATIYVEYANTGNRAMAAPLIQLRSADRDGSDRPLLTLKQHRLSEGFWTSSLPEGFGHSVTILGSGSQAGFLNPGERVRVPVYYAGLLQPWNFADDKVELGLSWVRIDDDNGETARQAWPMNWRGMAYPEVRLLSPIQWPSYVTIPVPGPNGEPPTQAEIFAYLEQRYGRAGQDYLFSFGPTEPGVRQLRPESVPADAWDAVVDVLEAQVGGTVGDWVRALDENAQYLARQGLAVSDVDDLWSFEVQQASGFGPLPVLELSTDAAVVTPGLSLSFTRSFSNTIPGRYSEGPFGRGWTTGWDMDLSTAADGAVTIRDSSGSGPRYEPDVRTPGRYFSQPGDSSQLTGLSGGLFELRDPNGTITRFRLDGKIDYVQDPSGNRITATYTGAGLLDRLTHSSGAFLAFGYNGAGSVASVTDSAGRSTIYGYDPTSGYLLSATTDDGKVTRYTYNTTGLAAALHALRSVESGGSTRYFDYDALGRLDDTYVSGNNQSVDFSYDSAGTVSVNDGVGTTKLFYDHRGLLAKVEDPLGNITTAEYDLSFNLQRVIFPTGEAQGFAWDKAGNLTGVTDELGRSTTFRYDSPLNRLTSFTDAKGNTTQYGYDATGNLLSTTYPNNSVERLTDYTPSGLPRTYTNRRGQPLAYEYYPSGQVKKQTFADGSHNDFTYDGRGNLLTATQFAAGGPGEVTRYDYDYALDGDRLKRVTYPSGRYLEYDYDAGGRRERMTDQDGYATKYEYDAAGRLWRLRDAGDTLLVTYTYDAAGRLARVDKCNGTFTTYEYDGAGQLLHLVNYRTAGVVNSRFDYTYDARSRRRTMATLDGTWTYTYDGTGQLTHAVLDSTNPAISDQDLAYEYDALGNRTRTVLNGVTTVYETNSLNQYTSVGGVAYRYDADGNLTSDGANTYEYNQQNRLVRATGPAGTTEFAYDAVGNLIGTVRNGQPSAYLLDQTGINDVVAEYDARGNATAHNAHAFGLVGRKVAGQPFDFFDFDALGSVIAVTDVDGTVIHHSSFDPFGATLSNNGLAARLGWTGQWGIEQDNELYIVRARAYSAPLGRFISTDPAGLASGDLNLYRYSFNATPQTLDFSGASGVNDREVARLVRKYREKAHSGDYPGDPTYAAWSAIRGDRNVPNSVAALSEDYAAAERYLYGYWWTNSSTRDAGYAGTLFSVYFGNRVLAPADQAVKWIGARKGTRPSLGQLDWAQRGFSGLEPPDFPAESSEDAAVSGAVDPNEKLSAAGIGPQHFIRADATIPYRVNFENLGPASRDPAGNTYPTYATAPAQRVTITDQLSVDLDWASFRLTELGFGDSIVSIPADSRYFSGTAAISYNARTIDVLLEAGIDLATGRVFATFQSIDPATGLPPDVLTGFLPPEDGTGRGKGYFSYTVRPKVGLPTGTEIRNVALISFDGQAVIATNQVDPLDPSKGTDPAREALNTIDATPPGVAQILVGGTGWSAAFLDYLRNAGLGDGGFAVPLNSAQAVRLPWANLNQVRVRFTEDVKVDAAALVLRGAKVPVYEAIGFDYDPETFTATWTFAQPITADKLRLDLGGPVADLVGNNLAAAAFSRIDLLPADVTRDGRVDALDLLRLRTKLGASTTQLGAGAHAYTPFDDVNGNGRIEVFDYAWARAKLTTRLPAAAAPIAPPALFSNQTISHRQDSGIAATVVN